MDGHCPSPAAVPAHGQGVTNTPSAERDGQPGGVAREGKGLGTQEGWGHRRAGDVE